MTTQAIAIKGSSKKAMKHLQKASYLDLASATPIIVATRNVSMIIINGRIKSEMKNNKIQPQMIFLISLTGTLYYI